MNRNRFTYQKEPIRIRLYWILATGRFTFEPNHDFYWLDFFVCTRGSEYPGGKISWGEILWEISRGKIYGAGIYRAETSENNNFFQLQNFRTM